MPELQQLEHGYNPNQEESSPEISRENEILQEFIDSLHIQGLKHELKEVTETGFKELSLVLPNNKDSEKTTFNFLKSLDAAFKSGILKDLLRYIEIIKIDGLDVEFEDKSEMLTVFKRELRPTQSTKSMEFHKDYNAHGSQNIFGFATFKCKENSGSEHPRLVPTLFMTEADFLSAIDLEADEIYETFIENGSQIDGLVDKLRLQKKSFGNSESRLLEILQNDLSYVFSSKLSKEEQKSRLWGILRAYYLQDPKEQTSDHELFSHKHRESIYHAFQQKGRMYLFDQSKVLHNSMTWPGELKRKEDEEPESTSVTVSFYEIERLLKNYPHPLEKN